MKYLFSCILLGLLWGCATKPAVTPRIQLKKGDAYAVRIDVDVNHRTKFVVVHAGTENQHYSQNSNWLIEAIEEDSIYTVKATIQSQKLSFEEVQEVKLGVPDSLKRSYRIIPLDTIIQLMTGMTYQFKVTHHGNVLSTTGADSTIYKAFIKAYGNQVPDSIFRDDFLLLKSVCGNLLMRQYLQHLFAALPAAKVWKEDDEYSNEMEFIQPTDMVDNSKQQLIIYSHNDWVCKGRDSSGAILVRAHGSFSEKSNNELEKKSVGFGIKVEGSQDMAMSYDTLRFMPKRAEIVQRYAINLGLSNIIFQMNFGTLTINRTIQYTLIRSQQ